MSVVGVGKVAGNASDPGEVSNNRGVQVNSPGTSTQEIIGASSSPVQNGITGVEVGI